VLEDAEGYFGSKWRAAEPTVLRGFSEQKWGLQRNISLDRVLRGALYCDTPHPFKTIHPRLRPE